MRKYGLLLTLALTVCGCAFAQGQRNAAAYQTSGGGPVVMSWAPGMASRTPVLNEPYSATVTIGTTRTLADGNRIVRQLTGKIARDSQGRTRRDIPTLASTAKAPHIAFIQDPVTHTTYDLNLTDKTARKIPFPSTAAVAENRSNLKAEESGFVMQMGDVTTAGPLPPIGFSVRTGQSINAKVSTEDLGSKTMEGLLVNGKRITRTISAGQIGNAKPITIITETWTSPELETVVYSKRIDPRMGQEIYQLTHINRAEPDPSLFTVPADFKVIHGPQPMIMSGGARWQN